MSKLNPEFATAFRFETSDGTPVYHIFDMLEIIQKKRNIDFWDAKGYSADYDNWCDSKGFGAHDNEGIEREHSKIWFNMQEREIEKGIWKEAEYCSFTDVIVDEMLEITDPAKPAELYEIYEVLDPESFLQTARSKDIKRYGKEDFNTEFAKMFLEEIGEITHFTGG